MKLLIINADDWGGFREGTDAIEKCFITGSISSTTAMVHMADSRRAAELALERQRPTGLHLNFTQPFDSSETPIHVRERQRRLCDYFANLRRRRWWLSPDPRIHRLVADGLCDQLDQYRERYGAEPTHIDSHHHVHVCPDVLWSKGFQLGMRVRQTLSPEPSKRNDLRHIPRRVKHELLARRYITTSFFWQPQEVASGFGTVPIAQAVDFADECPVEIMVHPSFEKDRKLLHSDRWLEALSHAPLGSYAELSAGL
ncbi:MAG: ChbG/HpnK family deacetylase [Solirubrobacteraceae bacterium]